MSAPFHYEQVLASTKLTGGYWIFSFKSTPGVMRDPFDLFDISTGTLESMRLCFLSARPINYCPNLALTSMPDHSKLAIPLGLESSLLPSPDLSLWDFASFELPRPSLAVAKAASEANNLQNFFVAGVPQNVTADDTIWWKKLYEYAANSFTTSDNIAVRCLHLPSGRADSIGLMPVWIIGYWKRGKDLRPTSATPDPLGTFFFARLLQSQNVQFFFAGFISE
ncbi:hypothetical protein B0H14DRAFT_2622566 [Mycena olivaceomarginata]|nr:hypothetical protein B0H14DRAFT_2622566 [Mycena olivaceomarginata]